MDRLTVSTLVNAPIEAVWQAYTTPEAITQWNFASDDWHCPSSSVDLRPGGSFSSRMESKDGQYGFDFAGEYTDVVPNERIGYKFGERTADITFNSTPEGVKVDVSFEPEETHSLEQQTDGWQAILNNFKAYCER